MTHSGKCSTFGSAALALAIGCAVLVSTGQSLAAATRLGALEADVTTAAPQPQNRPLDWIAVDDPETGVVIQLPSKWVESPESPDHEQQVVASSGWHFSRIYLCVRDDCAGQAQTTLSGGKLPPGFNIRSGKDLRKQIPLNEITHLGAMIAGVPHVDANSLKPISYGAAHGYRMSIARTTTDGARSVVVVDCLYNGDRFVVLTALNEQAAAGTGERLLDEICRTVSFRPRAKAAR